MSRQLAIELGLVAVVGGILAVSSLLHCGCASGVPGGALTAAGYQTELVACAEQAPTLAESIRCENDVRSRYGRRPRWVFAHTDAHGNIDVREEVIVDAAFSEVDHISPPIVKDAAPEVGAE